MLQRVGQDRACTRVQYPVVQYQRLSSKLQAFLVLNPAVRVYLSGVVRRPERPHRPVLPCLNSEVLHSESRAMSSHLSGLIHPGWIPPAGAEVPRVVCPASGRPPWVGVCLWTLGRKGARGGPDHVPPPPTRWPFSDPRGPAHLMALSVTSSRTGVAFWHQTGCPQAYHRKA